MSDDVGPNERAEFPIRMDMFDYAGLRDSGLLWFINTSLLHPRGYALAVVYDDDGQGIGLRLIGDGTERIAFAESASEWPPGQSPDDRFQQIKALLG